MEQILEAMEFVGDLFDAVYDLVGAVLFFSELAGSVSA